MANLVRGFRRIGWVVTVPLAVLIVFLSFESTKEFSTVDYQVSSGGPDYDALANTVRGHDEPADTPKEENVIEMPDLGYAHFSKEVPLDVAAKVIAEFNKNPRKNIEHGPWEEYQGKYHLDDNGKAIPPRWTFTVHKRVNKLKLTGLVAASIAIPVLVIQGLISVLAWIVRGFKG